MQQTKVNPLAGCLPSFAQIPIFIGLYRALQALAAENAVNEPFLWIPNLEGPVFDKGRGRQTSNNCL
jgi:YidC/Oxa1 family membrane protein insertase